MQVLKPFLHNGKRFRRGEDAPSDLDKQAIEQHKRLGMIGAAPAQADAGEGKAPRSPRRTTASPAQGKPARPTGTKPAGPGENKPAGPDQVQHPLGPAGDGADGTTLGNLDTGPLGAGAAAGAPDAPQQSPAPEGSVDAQAAQQSSDPASAAD